MLVAAFLLLTACNSGDPDEPSAAESFGVVERELRFEEDGHQRLSIHFVAPDLSDDSARACAKAFADEEVATVSCYGYESEEAVEVANPNERTGELENLCWNVYYSRSETGAEAEATENSNYGRECP